MDQQGRRQDGQREEGQRQVRRLQRRSSSKGGGYQGHCWTCGKIGHKSSECRLGVAGIDEEDADCRKVEFNLKQKKTEKLEACGSLELEEESRRRKNHWSGVSIQVLDT